MKRREFISLVGGAAAWPVTARAQHANGARIGFLGAASATGFQVQALRAGLRDFGYIEGNNIAIEYRFAEGKYERLPELAIELVALKVSLIVTHSTAGTKAAKAATATIPIVMAVAGDAVAAGLVTDLARPGGNVTGSTFFDPEVMAKRLELLKELVSWGSRIAVLLNPDNPLTALIFQSMEATAKLLRLEVNAFYVRSPSELASVFADIALRKFNGVVINDDPVLIVNAKEIASLTIRHQIPAIAQPEFAALGGLMAYGTNLFELFRRAGYFVDRILKGAKPSDLPIERPTKFDLVINLKAANELGLTVPPTLLARADRVIE
jgi:putative ABC transport system substrate-binding protein